MLRHPEYCSTPPGHRPSSLFLSDFGAFKLLLAQRQPGRAFPTEGLTYVHPDRRRRGWGDVCVCVCVCVCVGKARPGLEKAAVG